MVVGDQCLLTCYGHTNARQLTSMRQIVAGVEAAHPLEALLSTLSSRLARW
jgi:hypothetical protein